MFIVGAMNINDQTGFDQAEVDWREVEEKAFIYEVGNTKKQIQSLVLYLRI